jgi:hypothetical protein
MFQELIDQKLIESYAKDLRRAPGCTQVFKESSEEGRKRWEDLKLRVVEHNIRIMSKYYKRITLTRCVSFNLIWFTSISLSGGDLRRQ